MTAELRTVIVVGAGPVGLATAIDLALRGLDVTVLERRTEQTHHTKATTIWPRQLELLARLGVDDLIIRAGQPLQRVTLNTPRRQFAAFSFDTLDATAFRFGIGLAQTTTERILEDRALELGVTVERGVTVVGVTQDDDRVTVQCSRPGGYIMAMSSRWLVAADGAKSEIRSWMDSRKISTGPPIRFAVTDAEISANLSDSDVAYYYGPRGAVGLVPFGGSRFRVAMGVAPETEGAPLRGDFEAVLRERAGNMEPLEAFTWSSVFNVQFGHAEEFRRGRIFLVGDAAHTLSPAGGQGMNTGLQDAANLAWKLAQIVHGRADESILDSYQIERLPDYLRSARTSARMTQLGLTGVPVKRLGARAYFTLGAHVTRFRRHIAGSMAQLESNYPSPQAAPLAGRRFPSAPTAQSSAISGLPHIDPLTGGRVRWAGRKSTRPSTVPEPAGRDSTIYASDIAPHLARRLGSAPRTFIVRPDGHVQTSQRQH
ncbi:FAD-dependent oxidoreductase [Pseudoclavibacter sp. VKM Ac-2888]|uniref:FAD-dependent oxidoreductase n=1 Tax=Pseudoclavibacter sp. VKM Ac-2888 TaxID=2783830 RepID=UPI001889E58C|nr:FAD-dependent oxidoreductase [Pseudoclavibacter sp. VKM Ac-2888]MBF4549141.1 FAD-dependent oxidoreductase [Pseudoclavibacter sp. VKM Ac-2888]